ncbi:MAG: integrase [Paraglaciecola sp.]|jgi:integrase
MDTLTYDLLTLCKRAHDGSYGTQAQRKKQLKLIARQLKEQGFRHMKATSLRAKHVEALVKHWLTTPSEVTHKPIARGTLKNRMSALRWWAEKIGRSGVIPKDNRSLGIPNRQRVSGYNKAFTVTQYQLEKLPNYLQISLLLQQEFGLRREEAAKFIPSIAVKKESIFLQASWTKGGKERSVPITTAAQKELLKDIKSLADQKTSLIPGAMDFAQYKSHRDYHLTKTKIRKAHGLRHHYAQQRYIVLTNGLLPPMICKGERPILTEAEQALDLRARLIVSTELGHGRIDVTIDYLG